eukprot:6893467-Pyramimonas_sp.AAC.1
MAIYMVASVPQERRLNTLTVKMLGKRRGASLQEPLLLALLKLGHRRHRISQPALAGGEPEGGGRGARKGGGRGAREGERLEFRGRTVAKRRAGVEGSGRERVERLSLCSSSSILLNPRSHCPVVSASSNDFNQLCAAVPSIYSLAVLADNLLPFLCETRQGRL